MIITNTNVTVYDDSQLHDDNQLHNDELVILLVNWQGYYNFWATVCLFFFEKFLNNNHDLQFGMWWQKVYASYKAIPFLFMLVIANGLDRFQDVTIKLIYSLVKLVLRYVYFDIIVAVGCIAIFCTSIFMLVLFVRALSSVIVRSLVFVLDKVTIAFRDLKDLIATRLLRIADNTAFGSGEEYNGIPHPQHLRDNEQQFLDRISLMVEEMEEEMTEFFEDVMEFTDGISTDGSTTDGISTDGSTTNEEENAIIRKRIKRRQRQQALENARAWGERDRVKWQKKRTNY